MTDFIRELCDTEFSEINAQYKLPEEAERLLPKRKILIICSKNGYAKRILNCLKIL